ncbi:MAG: sigma-70 family RNA polymerase sigma factor [bacterium]
MLQIVLLAVGPDEVADAELIRRTQKGDREAYGVLVRRYQKRVYRLCRRYGGSHDVADDLTQEAFIKAYQAIGRFDRQYSFWSWLATIATNNALNYLKRQQFQLGSEESEVVIAQQTISNSGSNPEQELTQKEIDRRYDEALQALPSEFRTVFVLRMHEEQSYQEIARALKISIGTVMSRLHRARQRLVEALGDLLEK